MVARARAAGDLKVARVYGNLTEQPSWRSDASLIPVYTFVGPNSADIRLCIDAVDLFNRGRFDTAVIASSDGGLAHLAAFLREAGAVVLGFGATESPRLRAQCSEFNVLAEQQKGSEPSPLAPKPEQEGRIDRLLVDCLAHHKTLRLSVVGEELRKHGLLAFVRDCGGAKTYFAKRTDRYRIKGEGGGALLSLAALAPGTKKGAP
ncbi:NYN domain-containing protein [Jannaschia sp. W003]|uniref:NYN domain-containing protein n=1 Tax=Jannaschia sp. W003 TaxID=2867012 RepID=UPI0021A815A7|nr:NYN domain-containing protein [Jannaschia sp. W003]